MATYYVSPTGNDSAAGTSIGAPWRSIQTGASRLSIGDTLYLRGGRYQQGVINIPASASGNSGSRTKIAGYPADVAAGNMPIIDGQYTYPTGQPWWSGNPHVVRSGSSPSGYVYSQTGQPVWEVVNPRLVNIYASYVDFEDFIIERSRGTAFGGNGPPVSHLNLRRITMRFIRDSAWYPYAVTDTLLEDCLIHDVCNFAPFQRSAFYLNWGGGTTQGPYSARNTYRRCTVHTVWGEGVYASRNDGVIENCTIYDCLLIGIYLEKTSGAIVRNCLIYQSAGFPGSSRGLEIAVEAAGSPYNGQGSSGNAVYNNIIAGWVTNFVIWGLEPARPDHYVNNNKIFNNTFINGTSQGVFIESRGSETGNEFANNIIYQNNNSNYVSATAQARYDMHNNNWYPSRPTYANDSGGDVVANPKLRNPTATIAAGNVSAINYELTDLSPAINAGSATNAPSTDIYGSTRSGAPDIGAHEYGGTSTPAAWLTAAFSANATSGTESLYVEFTNSTTNSGVSGITYRWQYSSNGGSTWVQFSTATSPTRVFAPGTWSIRLMATGTDTNGTTITSESTRINYLVVYTTTIPVDPIDPDDPPPPPPPPPAAGDAITATTMHGVANATSYDYDASVTPTAGIFAMSGVTAQDSSADGARISFGFATDAAGYALGLTNTHGVGSVANSAIIYANASIALPTPGTNTVDALLAPPAYGAGSMGATWTYGADEAWRMSGLLLAADEAATGSFLASASNNGTTSVSLSFDPDVVILLTMNVGGIPAGGGQNWMGFGWAVNGSNQCAVSLHHKESVSPSVGHMRLANYAYTNVYDGAHYGDVEITAFSSGFTATTRNLSSWPVTPRIAYMALKFDDFSAWAGILDTPTSAGVTSYTTPAIQPQGLLLVPTMLQSVGSVVSTGDAGALGVGVWSNWEGYCHSAAMEVGATTTDTQSKSAGVALDIAAHDGGAGYSADVSAKLAGGFAMNFTTAPGTARKFMALVIEGPDELPRGKLTRRGTRRGMRRGF